jgi:demethoxyubiquinone hydroxylase (CLK1/Coq7/Cat5 family)
MERFATQIYRTQAPYFKNSVLKKQLIEASENESTHVNKLRAELKRLNYNVYPLGFIFQFAGAILGLITRLSGKRYLFKADIFVEKRAVKDYNGFLNSVKFGKDTTEVIRSIIPDEEVHIANWDKAAGEFIKTSSSAA